MSAAVSRTEGRTGFRAPLRVAAAALTLATVTGCMSVSDRTDPPKPTGSAGQEGGSGSAGHRSPDGEGVEQPHGADGGPEARDGRGKADRGRDGDGRAEAGRP
ncbi:hypothetical protein GTY57_10460, partial [Streptomyces sp. SID5475]|nr:hypothetical protein [Streptomyces sp. SID5475]